MERFWERSWSGVDMDRVERYIDSEDTTEDYIISCLREQGAETVCDAGCGCGAYSVKLVANGFEVFGFDVAAGAVKIAEELMQSKGLAYGALQVGNITRTSYEDGQFDAAVSRDVIDHMAFRDGISAVKELVRIVKEGGLVVITLDRLDDEYETEPHTVTPDGDYIFTQGKWQGMVFHPYSESDVPKLVQSGTIKSVKSSAEGLQVVIVK